MGCDIHGFIEYAYHNIPDVWMSHSGELKGELDLDRNYFMFSLLANVRCNRDEDPAPYPPRGYPKDMAVEALCGNSIDIFENDDPRLQNGSWYHNEETDERGCSRKQAETFRSGYVDTNKTKVWDPDRHTPSWLTYKEYCVVFDKFKSEIEKQNWYNDTCYENLRDSMKKLVDEGYFVRFVFSFDN